LLRLVLESIGKVGWYHELNSRPERGESFFALFKRPEDLR
jgi:hypothetical protein